MDDIILERASDTHTMNLDDDEQALLDEMEVSREININLNTIRKPPNFKPKQKLIRALAARPPLQRAEPEISAFTNPVKRSAPRRDPPPTSRIDENDDDEDGADEDGADENEENDYGEDQQHQFASDAPSAGYKTIDDEKADMLNKLARLEKKGLNVNKRLNAYSSISDIRVEYKRVTYSIEADASIRFSRRMLMACVSGLEFVNKRYNPVDIYLDGWSESVVENLDDYDNVFEELYNKYKTKMEVAPEVKLIMMLGGSAMMFHLTNSMFKSAIPNMNDILKKNPDLVKSMVDAVQNSGGGGGAHQAADTIDASGRREMRGPGVDLSSLMGGIMMPPPPPINTSQRSARLSSVHEDESEIGDDISDIVSVSGESTGGEIRAVKVTAGGGKRRGRPSSAKNKKNKNEISI